MINHYRASKHWGYEIKLPQLRTILAIAYEDQDNTFKYQVAYKALRADRIFLALV